VSDEEAYETLTGNIRSWIFGLPESELLLPLLKMRFTPDEAEFLSRFPHKPTTLEELAGIYGKPKSSWH
jgi:hypothetical protein